MQCAADSFRINSAGSATYAEAQIGSNCSLDYIGIEGRFIDVTKNTIVFDLNNFLTLHRIISIWSRRL